MPLDSQEFSLDSVKIDQNGVVVIHDDRHRIVLESLFKDASPEVLMGDNGICGSNCPEK